MDSSRTIPVMVTISERRVERLVSGHFHLNTLSISKMTDFTRQEARLSSFHPLNVNFASYKGHTYHEKYRYQFHGAINLFQEVPFESEPRRQLKERIGGRQGNGSVRSLPLRENVPALSHGRATAPTTHPLAQVY